MQCPACSNQLVKKIVRNIELDICENHCGGIWFDAFELKHFDEAKEEESELLRTRNRSDNTIQYNKDRHCPKCTNITMMRHYFGASKKTEIDECAKCGGTWLDSGELHEIHESYPTEADKIKAAEALFNEIALPKLEELRAQSQKESEVALKFAHLFRFLCPSWYIKR